MIFCCNKIDEKYVNLAKYRYNEIKAELKDFLKKVGYNPENIPFIPISGWHGDNMLEKSPNLAWYKGPTLIEGLNAINPPKRPTEKPLRLPL